MTPVSHVTATVPLVTFCQIDALHAQMDILLKLPDALTCSTCNLGM